MNLIVRSLTASPKNKPGLIKEYFSTFIRFKQNPPIKTPISNKKRLVGEETSKTDRANLLLSLKSIKLVNRDF